MQIYNLDKLTYAGDLMKHQGLEKNDKYHFIKADIVDYDKILSLFKELKFDFVVHFAAESHVDRSIQDPSIFVKTNVLGTQNLLEASRHVGISKFIHVSTDEVYGELDFDLSTFFTEDTPLQPNSPYSASKAASDLLVRAYYETFGLPINITRCSNNYGPYQYPEKLIPLTIAKALKGENIPIYGDGRNIRDWLHVYDHCKAIDLIMQKGLVGDVYNIGGHNELTNLEVAQKIIHALDQSQQLITKIESLGWKPTYSFDKGLLQTIEWYLENSWLKQKI